MEPADWWSCQKVETRHCRQFSRLLARAAHYFCLLQDSAYMYISFTIIAVYLFNKFMNIYHTPLCVICIITLTYRVSSWDKRKFDPRANPLKSWMFQLGLNAPNGVFDREGVGQRAGWRRRVYSVSSNGRCCWKISQYNWWRQVHRINLVSTLATIVDLKGRPYSIFLTLKS